MTCGGTLFDSTGVPTLVCSPGFDPAVTCPENLPCTAVFGPGNVAALAIGCEERNPDRITIDHDCDTTSGMSKFDVVASISGDGRAGEAFGYAGAALGLVVGPCAGPAAAYGHDGEFCTEDDPPANRGTARGQSVTTGTISAVIRNALNFEGDTLGPQEVTGHAFNCSALEADDELDAVLVTGFTACDSPVLNDIIVLETLPAQGESLHCVGDCSRDGAVTVDELIVGASIALGVVDIDSCVDLDADRDDTVTVDEIVLGVMNALDGCPVATPAPTKTATPAPSATPGVCGQPVSDEAMAACRATRTEASCLANGGTWSRSFLGNRYCACQTGVGGCPCTDSSECPCVASLSGGFQDCERATAGTCLARIPFDGCYCLFDSNGEADALCWDP